MKQTAQQAIRAKLLEADPRRLAIHEMAIMGHSQTAISARLREMARYSIEAGQNQAEVHGSMRAGESFKEWGLTSVGYSRAAAERERRRAEAEEAETLR